MVANEASNPLDRVADLDLATADLAQRQESLLREYERNQKLLDASAEQARDTAGTGVAEDGAVSITVDANQRVTRVSLDPRALRLGSIARLERAILAACQAAEDDVARRLGRTVGDPVQQFFDSMPELVQLLAAEAYQPFLDPDAEPRKPTGRTRPVEPSIYEWGGHP